MQKKLTHESYISFENVYQLKLPLNIEYIIPNDDSVRLLGQIVEEMDLTDIYQSYSHFRNNQATIKKSLKPARERQKARPGIEDFSAVGSKMFWPKVSC